ncbi:MAG TPA: class I SAM-dependent methyltransferase [Solirubrobacteraceae bacterium]|nr:class I SAM-dependent methyltransferase [Solirubrobacteraceae bacterium]
MSGVTVSSDGIVTGNTYDKYGSTNPVVRRLMGGFERTLDELFELAAPGSVLDVGCGEGVLVHRWAERLPFAENEFDLASAIEVLEHLPDPERTIGEMARCARRHLLVSVPREPLWRMLNMARGAYWSALGNTPGHLNHWSRRSFVKLLARHGEVVEVRSPFPWTMLLVRL